MRRRIVSFIATLTIAAGVGTAAASIPSGSSTSFNVQDPAATIIASGQTPGEKCEWPSGEKSTTYCYESYPSLSSFTPAANGACEVTLDDTLYGYKTGTLEIGTGPGYLEGIEYGIAEHY